MELIANGLSGTGIKLLQVRHFTRAIILVLHPDSPYISLLVAI